MDDQQRQPDPESGPAPASGDAGDVRIGLLASLRAGLDGTGLREGGLLPRLPLGANPFEHYGSRGPQLRIEEIRHGRGLAKAALAAAGLDVSDAGGPAAIDRRVALMTQDMAAFGGIGGAASLRLAAERETPPYDFFA